jgi:hypothetical protein
MPEIMHKGATFTVVNLEIRHMTYTVLEQHSNKTEQASIWQYKEGFDMKYVTFLCPRHKIAEA